MSWEQAVKYLQHDPRFRILQKVSEKKKIFIAWKNQRYKEERVNFRLYFLNFFELIKKF